MAQSDFIGVGQRWLNPLDGAVDLDGDGSREIAVIETPHIRPTLRIHQWNGSKLDEIARFELDRALQPPCHGVDWTSPARSFCDIGTRLDRRRFRSRKTMQRRGWRRFLLFDLPTTTLTATDLGIPSEANQCQDFFDQNAACQLSYATNSEVTGASLLFSIGRRCVPPSLA